MKNTYLEQYKAQQLRACQLKQLSILEEIDRICQKHQIGYWLDGGTLWLLARRWYTVRRRQARRLYPLG